MLPSTKSYYHSQSSGIQHFQKQKELEVRTNGKTLIRFTIEESVVKIMSETERIIQIDPINLNVRIVCERNLCLVLISTHAIQPKKLYLASILSQFRNGFTKI